MKPDEKRKFGVSDLMILVASVGFGLGISQLGWPRGEQPPPPAAAVSFIMIGPSGPKLTVNKSAFFLPPPPPPTPGGGYRLSKVIVPIAQRVAPFVPCLATLSAGLVLLALRSPRPRRRRLMTRPGFVATIAATIVVVFEAGQVLLVYLADGRLPGPISIGTPSLVGNLVVLIAFHTGMAVGLAWTIQAIGGRWRAEKTWLDRSGRSIGVAWLVIGAGAGAIAASVATWGALLR